VSASTRCDGGIWLGVSTTGGGYTRPIFTAKHRKGQNRNVCVNQDTNPDPAHSDPEEKFLTRRGGGSGTGDV